jgi:hypothetical protein
MKVLALEIENVDQMTPDQEREFWEIFTAKIARDDGSAARMHLAAGNPIYYCEPTTPADTCIKEYPDGHRELVTFDIAGEHLVTSMSPESMSSS